VRRLASWEPVVYVWKDLHTTLHKPHTKALIRVIGFQFLLIESPLKTLPPARPRWRKVSHIITRYFLSCIPVLRGSTFSHAHVKQKFGLHRSYFLLTTRSNDDTSHTRTHAIPKRRRQPQNTFPNVPLQTREHALAGIRGMLRSPAGAQGAFTSRGAKP
jgi:hypothetical protein